MAWGGMGSMKHGVWKRTDVQEDKFVRFYREKLNVFSIDIMLGLF